MKLLEFYQKFKIALASGLFLTIMAVLLHVMAYFLPSNSYVAFGMIILMFALCIVWYRLLNKLHKRLMVIRYKQNKMSE